MPLDLNDVDIRVIDQRIGMGVGGFDTMIRVLHKPTGIIIEMPRLCRSPSVDREVALAALETLLDLQAGDTGFIPQPEVTRFEVIDDTGRAYTAHDSQVSISRQDEGRTIKVLISK